MPGLKKSADTKKLNRHSGRMFVVDTVSNPPNAGGRWIQLTLGVVCMALIANLQYAWTLFVDPMHVTRGWSLAEIQWAFSIFIATETWLTPAAGAIVDRIGPRSGPGVMIAGGGLLVGVGWVVNAYADSLALLYLGAAISGT